MSFKSYVFLFILFCKAACLSAQATNTIHKVWYWGQHPQHKFYQVIPDTTSSNLMPILLKTKGSQKGIWGTSYPVFHIDKDFIKIDIKIRYKTTRCRNLMLTFNSIDEEAKTIDADTICLPLCDDWMNQEYTLLIKRKFSIAISLEIDGLDEKQAGDIYIADFDVKSNGKNLEWEVNGYSEKKGKKPSVKDWRDLITSPIMDKKILAFGETVHGTETLSYMAYELIKERILHHNCKLVVLELPLSATLYMNRYVKNDCRYSLDIISNAFDSEYLNNFIPLLQWIKEYNAKNGNEITLLGVDGETDAMRGRMGLYSFLKEVNRDGILDSLCYNIMLINTQSPINVDTCVTNKVFSDKESKLIQYCVNNMQEYQTSELRFAHRDEKMAEMMRKICEMYLNSNTTASFYGHILHANYITSNFAFIHNSPSMGHLLKQRFYDDYSCLALSARNGEAIYSTKNNRMELHPIEDAPQESLENYVSIQDNDSIVFISMDDFEYKDIYKIRHASAHYSPMQFFYTSPKSEIDGIVIASQASHTNKKKGYQKTENQKVADYLETLRLIREKVTQ